MINLLLHTCFQENLKVNFLKLLRKVLSGNKSRKEHASSTAENFVIVVLLWSWLVKITNALVSYEHPQHNLLVQRSRIGIQCYQWLLVACVLIACHLCLLCVCRCLWLLTRQDRLWSSRLTCSLSDRNELVVVGLCKTGLEFGKYYYFTGS